MKLKWQQGPYLYLVRICTNPGILMKKLAERIKVDRTKNFFQQRKEKCISIYKKKKYRKGLEI